MTDATAPTPPRAPGPDRDRGPGRPASSQPAEGRFWALLAPVHDRAQATARRLCRSHADGDDLYQEAVVRALERVRDLRDDKAFPAWFYRVLLSVHRSRGRRQFWRRLLPLDVLTESGREPAGDDGGAWEDARTGAERMQAALATLPAVQREAVVLCDLDGYALAEVAGMQGVSLSAVKSRLVRGRARLRRHYQRIGWQHTGPHPDDRRLAHNGAVPGVAVPVSIADKGVPHDQSS